ncbi:MAG TPA: transporter substrate-binding domain-containing protein [Rheinheimera sp.]|nr:transporter substrate-binding domain-containing protein [Rheinheimera sp.]
MKIAALLYAILSLLLTGLAAKVSAQQSPATVSGKPTLIWCLDHFPRFHHYEDVNEPFGPSVDVMLELAKRANFNVEFTPPTTLSRCFRLLAEGKADLMINLRYSEERNNIMFMLPYSHTKPESLFLRYDDLRIIDSPAKLNNLTIAKIRGYLYTPAAMAYLQSHPRQVIDVDSIESALEMVLRDRVDGIIAPTVSTINAINTTASYAHRFRQAKLDFSNGKLSFIHIGLSRFSQHSKLHEELSKHLKKMVIDGTIERLYDDMIAPPELNPMEPVKH